MSLSANGRRSTFQRIIAGVCAVGLLFGATACQSDDEEPLIHANHDKGAKLGGTLNDLKSYDEIRAAQERLEKWGVEQTPEWLAICNAINRKALRQLGFDPQRDLKNRDGKIPNACAWRSEEPPSYVALSISDKSIAELDKRENFVFTKVVEVDGRKIHLGHVQHDFDNSTNCAANFEKDGKVYALEYLRFDDNKDQETLCDTAIELTKDS